VLFTGKALTLALKNTCRGNGTDAHTVAQEENDVALFGR